MVDRIPANTESVRRFLEAAFPDIPIRDRQVDIFGTRFNIVKSHEPRRCLFIDVEVLEDAESEALLERLRTDKVVERLREGKSIRVMAERTVEIHFDWAPHFPASRGR